MSKRGNRNRGITQSTQPAELASKWAEIGTPGIPHFYGLIEAAYHSDLYWPDCFALLNKIRRSDPEISIVRTGYEALARRMEIDVVKPENPNADDEAAAEFYESELTNMEGGITKWMDTNVSHTPFLGWSWWEVAPGLRRKDWRPPNDLDGEPDPWRSEADDGLIGIRRLAFRDHSSFYRWDMGDKSGRLRGMIQLDTSAQVQETTIPLENSLHVTFGDSNSPEGLTPLESVWRLERVKYALEIIQGIGFEHAAGHAKFTATKTLTAEDHANIKKAARAILTAQEGNYLALPEHINAEIIDVSFAAAPALLEAIRFYHLLKLQVYQFAWAAIASTAGTGAYSAMKDSSSMFLLNWNSMNSSFVDQYDEQIGRRLWLWNKDRFPQAQARPEYKLKPMSKIIDLAELAQFVQAISAVMPLGDDDYIEIRKRSGFLPEELPEVEEPVAPEPEPEPESEETVEQDAEEEMEPEEGTPDDEGKEPETEELARFQHTKAMFELAQELRRANELAGGGHVGHVGEGGPHQGHGGEGSSGGKSRPVPDGYSAVSHGGARILMKKDMDSSSQLLSTDDVKSMVDGVPEEYRGLIQDVRVTDTYWRDEDGTYNFNIAATYYLDDGAIEIHANDMLPVDDLKEHYQGTMRHETAHALEEKLGSDFQKDWAKAVTREPEHITEYAGVDTHEDFAETMKHYWSSNSFDRRMVERFFPERLKVLNKWKIKPGG